MPNSVRWVILAVNTVGILANTSRPFLTLVQVAGIVGISATLGASLLISKETDE